jgi:hypothetical protein
MLYNFKHWTSLPATKNQNKAVNDNHKFYNSQLGLIDNERYGVAEQSLFVIVNIRWTSVNFQMQLHLIVSEPTYAVLMMNTGPLAQDQ